MHRKQQKSVLVTGATGFIGRRLVPRLLDKGYAVRCLVRNANAVLPAGATRITGDLRCCEVCSDALQAVDTAYYLVHSLDRDAGSFSRLEQQVAENFVAAADAAWVKRVIFLSGLGEPSQSLSAHLASRHRVAEILGQGDFQLTVLQAAIIIGAGGASFETIRVLVRTQPILLAPHGLSARVQPIAVDDVIGYLLDCLEEEATAGEVFDIGGPEIFTYHELLERFARAADDVNLFLPTPLFISGLVADLVGLISTVKPQVAKALLDGLKNDVICRDRRIQQILPRRLIPFDQAVQQALTETEQQRAIRCRPSR